MVTAVAGVILYINHRISESRGNKGIAGAPSDSLVDVSVDAEIGDDNAPEEDTSSSEDSEDSEVCCGMHLVCEKTSLSPVSADIEYYDDEELDEFRGRRSVDYSSGEIEQFMDVLLTMRPDDVAGWSRSLQLRGIEPPELVREQILAIISEQRSLS